MSGRYHPVDTQRSHWSALACAFPSRCTILVRILLSTICSCGAADHGIVLACYPDVHWIDCHNTVHPRDLAKLSGHTESYPDLRRHHLAAIDIALPVLEHPISILADTATQAESILLVQSDRCHHRINSYCRLHDESGWRLRRDLGPGVPSPRLTKILADHVKYDGYHRELGNNGHERCRFHSISEETKRGVLARLLPSANLPNPGTVRHHLDLVSEGCVLKIYLGSC